MLAGDLIALSGESEDALRRIGRVPAAALGSCRRKINDAEAAAAVETFRKNNVRFFIYIGGNDSADTAHRLAARGAAGGYGLSVVCVPKTIDNDLPLTDHSPGYGSAARFLASVVADVGMETEAMRTNEPVKIIEVEGPQRRLARGRVRPGEAFRERRAAVRLAAGNPVLRGKIPPPRAALAAGNRLLPRGRQRDRPRRGTAARSRLRGRKPERTPSAIRSSPARRNICAT